MTANTRTDMIAFARAWLEAPLRTGAIAPSSRQLADQMVFAAAPRRHSAVVELGPGTGIVTESLLSVGIRQQDLVLVELNPDFAENLKRRYPLARVVRADAFSFMNALSRTQTPVGAVISSLPLYVYPKAQRQALCGAAMLCLEHGGRLVQFTYGPVSPITPPENVRAVCSRRIWRNLPPAVVWTYQRRVRTPQRSLAA
jgi:phosphatidylethanolamine/phosphatidyl-N-methylethanolamine N-methyltransferase